MLAAGGKVPDDRIIASILVLALGSFLNRKIPVLVRFNIPVAVTGGLLFTGSPVWIV